MVGGCKVMRSFIAKFTNAVESIFNLTIEPEGVVQLAQEIHLLDIRGKFNADARCNCFGKLFAKLAHLNEGGVRIRHETTFRRMCQANQKLIMLLKKVEVTAYH